MDGPEERLKNQELNAEEEISGTEWEKLKDQKTIPISHQRSCGYKNEMDCDHKQL